MADDTEKKVAFLPFHAINEFMLDEYRLNVVRTVLQVLPRLPENVRAPVDRMTKQYVKVPGFRNSLKAPAQLKAKPVADAFEKNPELVAAVLAAWAEAHPELREKVFEMLQARGWEILPPDADRTILPGFLTRWPKGEDFETLNQAFSELYPQAEGTSNDVSLMVVWLSGRLPYQVEGDEAETNGET